MARAFASDLVDEFCLVMLSFRKDTNLSRIFELNSYSNTRLTLLACLYFTAILLSSWSAIKIVVAGADLKLDQSSKTLLNLPGSDVEKKRLIQQHFSRYGFYVPLEDVSAGPGVTDTCGEAHVSVWLPLRFKIPLVGERVLEWCLTKQ